MSHTEQTWRVVCEGDDVTEVTVKLDNWRWTASTVAQDGSAVVGRECGWERAAVARLVGDLHWSVVEIRAPGELTTAEQLAQLTARLTYADLPLTCWSCGATDGKGCDVCSGSKVPK